MGGAQLVLSYMACGQLEQEICKDFIPEKIFSTLTVTHYLKINLPKLILNWSYSSLFNWSKCYKSTFTSIYQWNVWNSLIQTYFCWENIQLEVSLSIVRTMWSSCPTSLMKTTHTWPQVQVIVTTVFACVSSVEMYFCVCVFQGRDWWDMNISYPPVWFSWG